VRNPALRRVPHPSRSKISVSTAGRVAAAMRAPSSPPTVR